MQPGLLKMDGSEKRTDACERGADGRIDRKMQKMRLFVVSELLRADNTLQLRVKCGKKLEWQSSTQSKKKIS